jgi:S1-C subfamily serine protease
MLVETYRQLRHSIVAFVPRFAPNKDEAAQFPPIIGTGFVVHESGLIATNDHVIEAITALPGPKGQGSPGAVLFLILTEAGMVELPFKIAGIYKLADFKTGRFYYGPEKPDIGFVQIEISGLLPVTLASIDKRYEEGEAIATAGFPMGTDQLRAPGWLHQLSPTIQTGIISAVHPFPSTTPHGFTLNVMTQGGASGSPVFNQETGDVLGVLYAGVNECMFDTGQSIHRHPTNYSWAVPSHFLVSSLNLIVQREEFQSAKLRCKPLKSVFEEREAINPFTGERQRAPKIPW